MKSYQVMRVDHADDSEREIGEPETQLTDAVFTLYKALDAEMKSMTGCPTARQSTPNKPRISISVGGTEVITFKIDQKGR